MGLFKGKQKERTFSHSNNIDLQYHQKNTPSGKGKTKLAKANLAANLFSNDLISPTIVREGRHSLGPSYKA
jgi:hypothetical protein